MRDDTHTHLKLKMPGNRVNIYENGEKTKLDGDVMGIDFVPQFRLAAKPVF